MLLVSEKMKFYLQLATWRWLWWTGSRKSFCTYPSSRQHGRELRRPKQRRPGVKVTYGFFLVSVEGNPYWRGRISTVDLLVL